jgi:aspartate/methionine/tyrosine aminotransferase
MPTQLRVTAFAGVLLPKEELEAAAAMCAAAGTWLILDNTYEDFVYEGRSHHTVSGPNVISVYSFSKAYGEGHAVLGVCFCWLHAMLVCALNACLL